MGRLLEVITEVGRTNERYAVDVDMRMGWRNFLYFVGNFRYTEKNL